MRLTKDTIRSRMEIVKNDQERRFEMQVQDQLAYIEFFEVNDAQIYLTHTKVPENLQGNGIGTDLVQSTLEYLRTNDISVIPHCSFIRSFIKKNPRYKRLLDESVSLT